MEQHCAGPPTVPAELADSLGWLMARASHQVVSALSSALTEHRVTLRELSVLSAAASAPRSQLGLASAVGLDKTTMVATVDVLERRGLVRRDQHPSDRRIRLVAVTDEGRRLLAETARVAKEVENGFLAALPVADRDRLVLLLRALVRTGCGGQPSGSCL